MNGMLIRASTLLIFIASLLLASCTQIPVAVKQEWSGRFSATSIFKGDKDRHSGTFRLTDTDGVYQLTLRGPLGVTAATLTEAPNGSTLVISNEEPIFANSSEQLLERVIGTPLSLRELADYLSNNSMANALEKKLSGDGLQTQVERDGERIRRITIHSAETPTTPEVSLILLPSNPK